MSTNQLDNPTPPRTPEQIVANAAEVNRLWREARLARFREEYRGGAEVNPAHLDIALDRMIDSVNTDAPATEEAERADWDKNHDGDRFE